MEEKEQVATQTAGGGSAGRAGNKAGKRIVIARRVTLAAVFVAVIASLAFDSGIGTPCSFGVEEFFLLCPLGWLEAMLASKSLVPVALISGAVVVVFTLVFGRAWCAWGCPAPVIRRFFKRDPAPAKGAGCVGSAGEGRRCGAFSAADNLRSLVRDTRSWTLVGVLLATLIAGFPVFCLVCPIGLTFGTVGSLWHFFVDKQTTLSLVVFPLALVIELLVYRKWCANLCPVAGLLGAFSRLAVLFRPQIRSKTCLTCNGGSCDVCTAVCPEGIDKHAADAAAQLGSCMRCGECLRACPTASLHVNVGPGAPVE